MLDHFIVLLRNQSRTAQTPARLKAPAMPVSAGRGVHISCAWQGINRTPTRVAKRKGDLGLAVESTSFLHPHLGVVADQAFDHCRHF
jgi:hypothetical protein